MTAPARPRRERKADRLIVPGATADEIACDYALAPFDAAALDSERRWGIDRLPELVAPELAAKYGAAVAYLNDRINAADAAGTAAAATNCIRGLAAMDAAARAAGHQPLPAEVWIGEVDGHRFGVTRDLRDWPALAAAYPGLRVYSLREVGNALAHYGQMVAAVKDQFPGAEAKPRPPTQLETELEDEIPW